MKYVRVRDKSTGHEFSTPENDPLIKKGKIEVVDRKAVHRHPLPPKHNTFPKKKTTSPSAGDEKKEA